MNRDLLKVVKATGVELYRPRRKPPWRVITIAALAAVIGFGAGMSVWGPPDTIVKHTEGPVQTVYATPQAHPPTKVIEVDQPQSCKDSIALAAALANNAVIMSDSAGPLMDAMKEAGVAVGTNDKNAHNRALEKVSKLNSATLKAKADYAVIYPQFQLKFTQCEKESK